MSVEEIIEQGNRGFHLRPVFDVGDSLVTCADGFSMSVIAGAGTYCSPCPELCGCGYGSPPPPEGRLRSLNMAPHDYPGPYHTVEVGFPSDRPEPWEYWRDYAEDPSNPVDTVYAYVPVSMVRDLVALHGGETEQKETLQ